MSHKPALPVPTFVSFTKTWHSKPYSAISPARPELSAAGKNVVITGGGTGIGKATAIAFAQANASSISILGRRMSRLESAAEEIRAAGPKTTVLYRSADMTQRADVDAALKSISNEVGKIDVFIWAAGISPEIAPVKGYDEQELRRGFETIVMGAFNAIQAFLPLAAPDAKLINVSSGIAHIMLIGGVFNYAMNKLAVLRLFDFIAAEIPELHVVQLQPGVIKTEMNVDMDLQGEVDEVELPACFMVWLASPEAEFLRDRFVWANWDVSELLSRHNEIEENPMLLRVLLEGVPM